MTAKKTIAKKTPAKAKPHKNVRYLEHRLVPIGELAGYHKNPRRGNVRVIAESLFEHGQYRPIVVWTHEDGKPRSQGPEILAGNHTYKGAKFLDQLAKGETEKPEWILKREKVLGRQVAPWPEMGVVFIDASAEEAAEIVLVDNRSADLGDYDKDVLGEIIGSLPDPWGTGYTEAEFNLLATVADVVATEALEAIVNLDGYDPEVPDSIINLSEGLVALEEQIIDEQTPLVLLEASEEMTGTVVDLKENPRFTGVTQFEIPPLRKDMLVEDLPEMTTWAGSATRDLDIDDGYWFYNYGIDSTSGMKVKPGHIVLSFYAWDDYFSTWWDNCKDRVVQALNSQISMAVTPNFSQDEMPMIETLFQMYKSRYIGRYMQEAGIRVMPDLECRHDPLVYDLFKATTPDELPWASMQAQNIVAKTKRKDVDEKEMREYWEKGLIEFFGKVCRPTNLLVYANANGFDAVSALNDKHKWGINLRYQPTRMIALGEKAKGRTKKTGIV
jgi:hypothetical protein